MTDFNEIFSRAREASRRLLSSTDEVRSRAIMNLADLLDTRRDDVIAANARDLARMSKENPLYDRLQLTPARLADISSALRKVAGLPTPVDEEIESRTLPNGIRLRKVRVPYGVIGVIYEARPNVTYDVFALCLKSGNASVLKGGKDAAESNAVAIELIKEALAGAGLPEAACTLLPSTHEATAALLGARGFVDVCIPRGGRNLIDFVRDNARVPVIETGAGVVHTYFDSSASLEMGRGIVTNGKTRRVSVCNALDTLLIARDRLSDLPALCGSLAAKRVDIYADADAFAALADGGYPSELLHMADDGCWEREWMDYKMGVRTVGGVDEAIAHIALYGSGHSESIITTDEVAAGKFRRMVDASTVYVNLPTSFTDGGEFGLGAEIGISTQKLGPRGPMGLREITTTRFLLDGEGQLRP